jgi:DNA-directed RNA polymerase specialized sigma24 family protein
MTVRQVSLANNLRTRCFGTDIALSQGRTCEMAAITTASATSAISSGAVATAEEIRATFSQHREELEWLAEFLTGDEMIASACVIDASALTDRESGINQKWLSTWAREATIRSALDVQRVRIVQLSSVYDRYDCVPGEHAALAPGTLEFVVGESDRIGLGLDTICRFVLVLCGIENRPSREVASLLGMSEHGVEAAYGTALQSLDVMRSQAIVESYGYAAACN